MGDGWAIDLPDGEGKFPVVSRCGKWRGNCRIVRGHLEGQSVGEMRFVEGSGERFLDWLRIFRFDRHEFTVVECLPIDKAKWNE